MDMIEHIFSYWIKGSTVLLILAICSIFIIYYTVINLIKLKRCIKQIDIYMKNINVHFDKLKTINEIKNEVPKNLSFIKNIMNYLHAKKVKVSNIDYLFEEINSKELGNVQFDIVLLGAIISASPLLGLLGTVFGMIYTFEVLSVKSSLSTGMIAEGISQALITTQFGLIIALPGIFGSIFVIRKLKLFNLEMNNFKQHVLFYLKEKGKN